MSEELEEIRRQKLEELRNRAQEPDGTEKAQTPSTPISVDGGQELRSTTAKESVVLVDFFAEWCGPCQMLEPVLETVAAETDAVVATVDIDENQQLAAEYGVQGVPTLLLFVDGEPVERLVGMQQESKLRALVESHTDT